MIEIESPRARYSRRMWRTRAGVGSGPALLVFGLASRILQIYNRQWFYPLLESSLDERKQCGQ